MNRRIVIALGLAAVLASAAVQADVIFDTETGIGFVGKGDVQDALGWNNAAFQANANSLEFTYAEEVVQRIECTQLNGQGGGVRTGTRTYGMGGRLTYDKRAQNQVTGIFLTGFDGTASESFGDWIPDAGIDELPGACFNSGLGWSGVVTELSSDPAALRVNGIAIWQP